MENSWNDVSVVTVSIQDDTKLPEKRKSGFTGAINWKTRSPRTTSLPLLFLFMMNIRNVSSKESVGAKFKHGTCGKLCLKLWLESDWYFCIIKSEWFWKQLSRKKVLNNHFLKSLQKQPYAAVLQNRCS